MGLSRALFALLFCALLGCTSPRTELLIVTTTDLAIPAEIDAFEIEATSPGGQPRESIAHLGPGELPPPRVLGLVPDGGRLGTYSLRVRGTRGGAVIVERRAEVDLESGRTLVLRVHLTRDCVGVDCAAEETCAAGACRAARVGPEELEPYPGQLPGADGAVVGVDASPPSVDGGSCVAEQCNGEDDDCDGEVDETFDLSTDAANCGECGRACSIAGGTASCEAGECAVGGCDAGRDDCDGEVANGCEADLTLPASCGDCGTQCRPPNRDCCDGACC
jgi:hypothetical protein